MRRLLNVQDCPFCTTTHNSVAYLAAQYLATSASSILVINNSPKQGGQQRGCSAGILKLSNHIIIARTLSEVFRHIKKAVGTCSQMLRFGLHPEENLLLLKYTAQKNSQRGLNHTSTLQDLSIQAYSSLLI